MKRSLLGIGLGVLLLCYCGSAKAIGFNFGIAKLGTNVAGSSSSSELSFGLFHQTDFALGLSLRPELNFVLDSNELFYVPINIRYAFFDLKVLRPYIFFGPEIFLVAGAPSTLKKLYFGADIGAGFEVGLGGFLVGVSGRYSFGLTNLSDVAGVSIKSRHWFFYAHLGIGV